MNNKPKSTKIFANDEAAGVYKLKDLDCLSFTAN